MQYDGLYNRVFRFFNNNYSSRAGHLCHALRNPTDETVRSYLQYSLEVETEDERQLNRFVTGSNFSVYGETSTTRIGRGQGVKKKNRVIENSSCRKNCMYTLK